jgi:predicted nuclease of predicted toxin-antitoxin system
VARGFAVFTDNHVQQAVVDGLVAAGWDVVRAIDAFPEGTADAVLLEHAAKESRIFVTNDEDLLAIAAAWLEAGRSSRGSSTGMRTTIRS